MKIIKMNGNKTTAISAERRTQRGISVLAFFVPAFIMLVFFIIRGIYPFGDRSFLFSDMYHQYMPFLSEFVHKIKAGEGLFYSYNVGIGSNFLALYVYYLASPFNWLVFLLPESLIMEFMSYLVILRIGLMGLTFSMYLRKAFGTVDPAVVLFSACYALSGYLAAYNWNVMWLDCLILLPLILLGAERLAREGRWVMYTVTLGLCILTNYYISIMICIFLVLYFGMLLITEYHTMTEGQSRKARIVFSRIGSFAFASLLAGGLAAALLIPEVCAILRTDFGDSDFPNTLQSYFSVFDMLARHCMCVTTERGLEHWPNIYCGVAVFLLVPMYALNEKISVRKRFCNLALAGFLLLSFGTNVLDFMWHGLNYPDSLPARQSFLYIFLILVMCYDAFRNVEGTSPRQILYGYLAAVVFLLACEKFVESEDFDIGIEVLTLVFVTIYGVILYLYRTRRDELTRQVLGILVLACIVAELSINTFNTSLGTTGRTAYLGDQEDYKALYALSHEQEGDDFFRIEKFTRKTKNDGTLTGYPTASVFSSTMNSQVMDLYKKLGMRHSKVYYGFDGATAFVSALLNVDYMFGESDKYENDLYETVNNSGDVYLYHCKYTLPFGYVAPTGWDVTDEMGTGVRVQNQLIRDLGITDIFLERATSEVSGDNVCITADRAGCYYARINASGTKKVQLLGGPLETQDYSDLKDGAILYLGYLQKGERVTLTNGDDADETQKVSAEAYVLNEEVLSQAVEILSQEHLENVQMDSTHISGDLHLEEAGRLILSVPYEKGWTVWIDGEKTEPEVFGDALMAFDLEAGEHTIKMHYVPDGWKIGVLVSAGSVLLLLGCVLWQRYGGKKADRSEDEPSKKISKETKAMDGIEIRTECTETEENSVEEENGKAEE